MKNDEYIRLFLKKHNYDGNIIIQTKGGNTWDDVVSIICNEKDISSKKSISIDDIQYDILSDFPEDLFYQWIDTCKDDITYKEWITKGSTIYKPKVDNSNMDEFRNEVENAVDRMIENITPKYDESVIDEEYEDSDED